MCVDEFIRGFDEVLSNPALRDELNDGEEQERPVRCAMAGDLRIPVPVLAGPKLCEHLEVLIEHLSERTPQASVRFF